MSAAADVTMPQAGHRDNDTHMMAIGYLLWLVGFTGSHRFYYGKQLTGILWLCTGGLCGVGWFIDLFLIPGMDARADRRYVSGEIDYTIAWMLLAFFGIFGFHRFYMEKWITGIIYLCTGGLFLLGIAYDFCTLNEQISDMNAEDAAAMA